MSDSKVNVSGGPGLATLLTVLFVALKLMGHITWSWWWVLSPLWISVLFFLGVVLPLIFLLLWTTEK